MRVTGLLACIFLLMGCATGQCKRDGTPVVADEEAKTISEQELANEIIVIGKSDQSLQCGYNIGMSITQMAQELEGIQILRTEKRHDGLMRLQSCGAPTGMMNVYFIYRKDVKKSVRLGYKVLDTDK
jgi:hypothetical protein